MILSAYPKIKEVPYCKTKKLLYVSRIYRNVQQLFQVQQFFT